jgi:hypothetical protein
MTWASIEPASGEARPQAAGHFGLMAIAGLWLGVSALFNLVYGFGATGSPRIDHAHYMFGILHSSGWISIFLGVLQLLVAVEALTGNQLARWLGVALLALDAINQQYFISAYPFWSSLIILLDVVSIYALVRYGTRENLARSGVTAGRAQSADATVPVFTAVRSAR